ncbi:hypothetical protein G7054_g6946 [Neopestalotiopsis clavispora]|nr:hypothetical protein G7054_g6946 [Neopestalotiopsis clavispora]
MASAQPYHQYAHSQALSEKDMAIFDQNRETIRRLFLLENRTLAQVKEALESDHGFPNFRMTDYETVLRKRFGFRKNLKKEDWLTIDHHREERLQKGKASDVYLDGLLKEKSRVDIAIRRAKKDCNLPYRSENQSGAGSLLPEGITIRTPSPVQSNMRLPPIANAVMTIDVLSKRSLSQAANEETSTADEAPLSIGMTQRRVFGQGLRLDLPFNELAKYFATDIYKLESFRSTTPLEMGFQAPSRNTGSVPTQSDVLGNYDIRECARETAASGQRPALVEHRQDRITSRLIAFVGGKFAFEELMRVFFMLSNKQKIHENEARQILEWIESADVGVLQALFTLPFLTVAAAWEGLMDLSLLLESQDAFSKLFQSVSSIQNGKWLKSNALDVLGTAIWLGLGRLVKDLLKNGLSPVGRIVKGPLEILSNDTPLYLYNGECPQNLLEVATLRSDADTLKELLQYGAEPDALFSRVLGRMWLYRTKDRNHDAMLCCLKILLDSGAVLDVESQEDISFSGMNEQLSIGRLGWLPDRPRYLSDGLWHHSAKGKQLQRAFDLVSQKSQRIKDSLTVPALYDAASRGSGELERYLDSRTTPSGPDRDVLLEIALYEAAVRSNPIVLKTLIQSGVDPTVPEIYSQTSRPDAWTDPMWAIDADLADQWVPAFQASKNFDLPLLKILFKAGVNCNQHNLVYALLSAGEEHWTDLYTRRYPDGRDISDTVLDATISSPASVESTYDFLLAAGFDIQIHGSAAMTRVVKRWGRSNAEVACLQCYWLHSKGASWDAESDGLNLIHTAVQHRCDLDLVRFFVARGVKVHSTPCNGTTMLHDALEAGCSPDVIDLLLQQGANIQDRSFDGVSILQPVLFPRLIWYRRSTTITAANCKTLIEAGASIVPQRQDREARSDEIKSPSRLLAALIQLPGIEDYLILRLLESPDLINLCYDPECIIREDAISPMQAAIESERLNLAKKLLDRGGDEQYASRFLPTALQSVTGLCIKSPENGSALDFMRYLINAGACINSLGASGLSPLHHAAKEGSLNVASMLLENRADPNIPIRRVSIGFWDRDLTNDPDHTSTSEWSFRYRHPSKGEFTGDEGIFYDEECCPMFVPHTYGPLLAPQALDLAAFNGRLDMVKLLLHAGAISGRTSTTRYDGAFDSAQFNGHHAIVRLLEDWLDGELIRAGNA